jgi:hypothetical protein
MIFVSFAIKVFVVVVHSGENLSKKSKIVASNFNLNYLSKIALKSAQKFTCASHKICLHFP